MNGLSAIISEASAFVPVLADILVAVLLSWIDLNLYKTSQSTATHKADAVLLELTGFRSLDGCGDGPLDRHILGDLLLEP